MTAYSQHERVLTRPALAAMLVLKQYVPTEVLITWLSSTIVEIIGILWVIARSLFPFHDRHRDAKGEKHRS